MTTVVVFASSLSVASILVLIKAFDLRREKKNFVLRLLCRLDSKSDTLISSLKFRGLQLIQSIRYILSVKMKEIFKKLINEVRHKINHEYKARRSEIMGRKEISVNGSASFYLKKMMEGKGSNGKGRIE